MKLENSQLELLDIIDPSLSTNDNNNLTSKANEI